MKKCPYCSEEILDDAKKCKFCGEFLDETLKKERDETPAKKIIVEKKNNGLVTVLIVLAIIALIAFLTGM